LSIRATSTDHLNPLTEVDSSSAIGISIINLQHRFEWVNDAFCEIAQRSFAELSGKTLGEITHPDDSTLDASLAARLLRGEQNSYELEKRLISKNGYEIPIHLTATIVRGTDGLIAYVAAVIHRLKRTPIAPPPEDDTMISRIRSAIFD
jgi:PAS domain S-box-containing protein